MICIMRYEIATPTESRLAMTTQIQCVIVRKPHDPGLTRLASERI